MSITLPNEAAAHAAALAAQAAAITAAQDAFVANATVLINQAMALGQLFIQPYMVPLVTSDYITTYFTALGYAVLFPIIPPDQFNPNFIAGFPEVLPPGFTFAGQVTSGLGPPRIQISWTA